MKEFFKRYSVLIIELIALSVINGLEAIAIAVLILLGLIYCFIYFVLKVNPVIYERINSSNILSKLIPDLERVFIGKKFKFNFIFILIVLLLISIVIHTISIDVFILKQ